MEPTQILVVAHRTAATPTVVEAVRQRAEAGPCRFVLLVPAAAHGLHRTIDPEDHGREEAEAMLDLAVPLLEDAAGGTVDAWIGSHEPLAAVEDALNRRSSSRPCRRGSRAGCTPTYQGRWPDWGFR